MRATVVLALSCLLAVFLFRTGADAEQLTVIPNVEFQPLKAQAQRVLQALELLGEPHAGAQKALEAAKTPEDIQKILDPLCLAGININPESRVKVEQGIA